jgi:hypothetical protein
MSVVAKFFVQSVTEHAHQKGCKTLTLNAVSRGEENKSWSKYTPSGSITMSVLNEAASAEFILGEEYYVTFAQVEKPVDAKPEGQ